MKERDVYITGIGSFSPGEKIPFDKIEDVLGKFNEAPPKLLRWIDRMRKIMKEALGIEYAHYVLDPKTRKPTEDNVTMSSKSALEALKMAKLDASKIDLIVYAGVLMEQVCPPTTTLIQEALGIPYCAEISIHSNCTAIYKALQVAADLIANGRYNNALVVTSQISSAFLRAEHFNQKILSQEQVILRWFLCDGAGAFILTSNNLQSPRLKIVDTYIESVGLGIKPSMTALFGGNRVNMLESYENGWHHLTQNFAEVAKIAPPLFKKGLDNMIDRIGLDVSKVNYFFANIPTNHLMDLCVTSLRKDWNLPNLKFYTKLGKRGYPGAPAIVIALGDFMRETKLSTGDILVSFVTESSKWMHAGFVLEYCE